MIAAIYARKSTEQTGVADEQKSVARQVDHARAYATSKGMARRQRARLHRRLDIGRRIREPAWLRRAVEGAEAGALHDPDRLGTVATRA